MQPEYRTIGGTRIRFATGGRQDGPVVLLLCPLPQSILCYDPIWKILQDHCRLVAVDLPGFGRSEGGMEYMSFKAQGDFVEKFVNELELEDVHVVGPDVGMAAALSTPSIMTTAPASSLVGEGRGIVPLFQRQHHQRSVFRFFRMMFRRQHQAFVEGGYRLTCVDYIPCNDEVADYVASYDGRLGPITYWFKTYPENLATVDPHLDDLDLPTQIFWGDLDIFLLVNNGERLNGRMKRSQLKVFENCGHFLTRIAPMSLPPWFGIGSTADSEEFKSVNPAHLVTRSFNVDLRRSCVHI